MATLQRDQSSYCFRTAEIRSFDVIAEEAIRIIEVHLFVPLPIFKIIFISNDEK